MTAAARRTRCPTSPASRRARRRARPGNAIVKENCFPGTTAWKLTERAARRRHGGIEGFATATSVNAGGSRRPQGRTPPTTPRTTSRSTARATTAGPGPPDLDDPQPDRQASSLRARPTTRPACVDCAAGSRPTTITTTAALADRRLPAAHRPRRQRRRQPHPARGPPRRRATPPSCYRVPTATYQAYNNYGGKSLYDFNSTGDVTVAGSHARGLGLLRPALTSSPSPARPTGTRTSTSATSRGSSSRATTSTTSRATTSRRRGEPVGPSRLRLGPRTTSTGRRACARRSPAARDAGTVARVPRVERGLLEDPLSSEPGHRRRQPHRRSVTRPSESGAADPSGQQTGHLARPERRRTSPRTPCSARCTSATTTA